MTDRLRHLTCPDPDEDADAELKRQLFGIACILLFSGFFFFFFSCFCWLQGFTAIVDCLLR